MNKEVQVNNHKYFNHPGVAAVLSFLFTGLGQLYNGQIKKGLILISISCMGMILVILGAVVLGFWFLGKIWGISFLIFGLIFILSGIVTVAILGVYSIIDAFRKAQG
jgi:TM2 domain-containing membrane protein YozV